MTNKIETKLSEKNNICATTSWKASVLKQVRFEDVALLKDKKTSCMVWCSMWSSEFRHELCRKPTSTDLHICYCFVSCLLSIHRFLIVLFLHPIIFPTCLISFNSRLLLYLHRLHLNKTTRWYSPTFGSNNMLSYSHLLVLKLGLHVYVLLYICHISGSKIKCSMQELNLQLLPLFIELNCFSWIMPKNKSHQIVGSEFCFLLIH